MKATTADAYKLMHEGAVALAKVEANGMRVDVDYLDTAIRRVRDRMKVLEGRLKDDEVGRIWRRRFGLQTNLGSDDQLVAVVYGELGYKPTAYTAGGRPKADADALGQIDLPFIKTYLELGKLQKLHGTYLKGVRRHVVYDTRAGMWLLRPFFNLHTTLTYRSSSNDPNFQNIPIRDPAIAKWIRRAFIARPGCRLVEIDFSGIEVRVAACYHKDPNMLAYIHDPTKDMHRDQAELLFMLPAGDVPKQCRQAAKGAFVFAEFYGDFYPKVARNLWGNIAQYKLATSDGMGLYEHLALNGIKGMGACDPKVRDPLPGSFEAHVKAVEHAFWHVRFPVYHLWRKSWYKRYEQTGGFTTLTGFRIEGVYERNQVINYPVQGSAFHCLLWCLIRLQRELSRRRWGALVVGQIHDSIVLDVPDDLVDDVVALAREIMLTRLPAAWPWLIVPLEVEVEAAPLDGSWHDKEKLAA